MLCREPGSCTAGDEQALVAARAKAEKAQQIAEQLAHQASGSHKPADEQRSREAALRAFQAKAELARLECLAAP